MYINPSRAYAFNPVFFMGSLLLIFLVLCVVLLCVFTFCVQCCDVHYDFRIKPMFSLSFSPVVCGSVHVLFMLFVFVFVWWRPVRVMIYISSSCLTYVSSFSGLSILVASSVFSNIYFSIKQ